MQRRANKRLRRMSEFYHKPVLFEEVLAGLNIKEGGIYYDATVGGGGHSYGILSSGKTVRLIGTDRDEEAIAAASKRLEPFKGRFELYKSNYKDYELILDRAGADKLDGVLLDFGISSHQIDDEERGFSYRKADAPLDMRMDRTQSFTAEDVVGTYEQDKLCSILRKYGEESFANSIARNIVREREKAPIKTCGQLAKIVEESIPPKFRSAACARQTFQAIRIEVNGELAGLEECLRGLIQRLKPGGRMCVLTFHSLEDRIVKQLFAELAEECSCPKSFPVCVCGKKNQVIPITKKPIVAGEEERSLNSRSKCAKLRIAERV